MVYTSYFAQCRKIPEWQQVSIARWNPRWFSGAWYEGLAPSPRLLKAYKEGKVDEAKYAEVYKSRLTEKRLAKFKEFLDGFRGEHVYLLCYEKPEDFCHRHLVADWLNENGIVVKEATFTEADEW